MSANLVIRSRADAPYLSKAASAIEQAAWSNLGFLNYTRAHYEYYAELLDTYPEYQLCLVDEEAGYPVAVANSVPFACSGREETDARGRTAIWTSSAGSPDSPMRAAWTRESQAARSA